MNETPSSNPSGNTLSLPVPKESLAGVAGKVYMLLSEVLRANADPAYADACNAVLDAAKLSEEQGVQLSALPLLTCAVSGGSFSCALPAAAAWKVLHIAAQLLDDVEDNDVLTGNAHHQGYARVINLATGFISAANLALLRVPPRSYMQLQERFQRTILRMASGQHEDLCLHGEIPLDGYFTLADAKTASFFALGASAGAICAGAHPATVSGLEEFGHHLGMALQLSDDLSDWMRKGNGDLAHGKWTVPVHYSLSVAAPAERTQLLEYLMAARFDVEAEEEARSIMLELGAKLYVQVEIAQCRRLAVAALERCAVVTEAKDLLFTWFENIWGRD